jgi:large subunit ribosomal protein L19e
MKLDKKKALAARIFRVGKERIIFVEPRLDEIKEAITKEDIRSLKADGAIIIRPIKARRSKQKRKVRRGPGNIKKNAKNKKKEYIVLTRKLRKHIQELKNKNLLTSEQSSDIRKKIRNRYFRSKSHLKEYIETLEK